MKAVVMAGGEGSRLRPLTSNRPKPLVPVGNVPIMEHILGLLKRHGFNDVVATLYYLGEEIEAYFEDGSDFDVRIRYSRETGPLGTAGSVKRAEHLLDGEPFLVISGDALTDCDLTAAVAFHRAKGAAATLVLYRVPTPLEFGVVITDADGRVERFLEKPSWSEVFSDTVNTGIYIIEPEVLARMESDRPYDWSGDVFPAMLEAGEPIYGFVMDGYWADVGNLTQYREAQEDLLMGKVQLPLGGAIPSGGVVVDGTAGIEEGAHIVPPVVLGRNVRIKRGAVVGPFVSLGDNCTVYEGAFVERSVLWDSVYVGPNVGIHSAIVGSRSAIKKDSVLREESVIGDRVLVDVGCTIRPKVKIWPDKQIDRGSTVTMSLIHGTRWRGTLFRDLGVAGISNIEITPDFACRLGSAFGSCFPNGARIVTSRDSTRSSRMIKRAIISALLSSGCDVLDLRSAAVPIARHFIKSSGAMGAMNVRKLPGNSRVSLIEMFDGRGGYLSRSLERKVESSFYREDFRRTDPDDLGSIHTVTRAIDEYVEAYFAVLGEVDARRRLKVVCDYGFSSVSAFMPAMLERLGVDSIALNAFSDAKRAPRSDGEVEDHIANLRHIVGTLGYDMGVLFTQEGERLTVVDGTGQLLPGHKLFAVLGCLQAQCDPESTVAISVAAPSQLEEFLKTRGLNVLRTKSDVRGMMDAAMDAGVEFGGDDRGGFLFPSLHPGFDAPFTFGKLVALLQRTGAGLAEVAANVPEFHMAYEQVRVPWESKGMVMRRLVEDAKHDHIELVDGVKLYEGDSWVLVLPDSIEPAIHLYAEAPDAARSTEVIEEFARRIAAMI